MNNRFNNKQQLSSNIGAEENSDNMAAISQSQSSIEQAPDSVKLAVDLIYLLETHNIAPATALEAIEMVKRDLQQKLA